MREDKKAKLSKLAYLLFFKRHIYPGARDWELERYLGRNYRDYLKDFNEYIEPLGLYVEEVQVEEGDARVTYYVVKPKGSALIDYRTFGWRIDEVAVLTISLGLVLSGGGRVLRREIEDVVKDKIPSRYASKIIDKLIKLGYLEEDGDYVKVGLRSRLEINLDLFASAILGEGLSHAE